jgi:hypothetical protein
VCACVCVCGRVRGRERCLQHALNFTRGTCRVRVGNDRLNPYMKTTQKHPHEMRAIENTLTHALCVRPLCLCLVGLNLEVDERARHAQALLLAPVLVCLTSCVTLCGLICGAMWEWVGVLETRAAQLPALFVRSTAHQPRLRACNARARPMCMRMCYACTRCVWQAMDTQAHKARAHLTSASCSSAFSRSSSVPASLSLARRAVSAAFSPV